MAEPFQFTFGRWYNRLRDDGDYAKAPAYREGFTYDGFAYGTDAPEHYEPPADAPGGLQTSLICSPSAQFLAIDVDYPAELPESATGKLVSWADAVSTRSNGHFHVGVDMRGVPEEDWPAQGHTAWGDIKAAGFIPLPGSVHKSGEPYAETAAWHTARKLVTASSDLLAALRADRDSMVTRRQAERGAVTGTGRLENGLYVYDSGYVRGTWKELREGSLTHDDELKDLVFDMHVEYGLPEHEVRQEWERLAGALAGAWTERDFARHWRRVPGQRAQRLENDDTLRFAEDFGLKLPEAAWEAAQREQERVYQQAGPGPRPPEPPKDWGFEVPGVDYFSMWLGSGIFDAGRPTDADNALAVLTRAHSVLRYDEEAGTWLLRGTGKWVSFTGPAGPRAVVNALRDLMPEGCADPVKLLDKDPETDGREIAALKAHAKNKERFSASSSVAAVAAVMTDTVLRHRGQGSVVRSRALDTEPEILWAGGVPWDLRASADGPVQAFLDRSAPHLMTAPVVPDPSVPTPLWDAYCRAVFPDLPPEWGDQPEAGREWALNVFAAAFTGYADALMPVLLGETRTGKTFLVNLLTSVLGDYGGVMSADLIKADARLHGSFTLKLKGMRLAFVDEAPGRGKASQEHLKKITGGGKMEGNKMRENPVEFFPTHTLVLAANKEPDLTDPALLARARMIRFEGDRSAVKAAAAALGGSTASAQWQTEMYGVLAQMMARAARWLADRSLADTDRAPRLWQSWTDDIVTEQDPFQGWLKCGELAYDAHGTHGDVLHEHHVAYCKRHGEKIPLDRIDFGYALRRAGYGSRKSNGVKWWPLKIVLPGAAEFMRGPGQGGEASLIPPTVPGTVPSQNASSETVIGDGRDGRDTTHTNNTHSARTHTHTQESDRGISPSLSPLPSLKPSDLQERDDRDGDHEGPSVPGGRDDAAAGVHTDNRPENGEKAPDVENRTSPPKQKSPRTKLTDEERTERAAAKKAALAQERADARTAKIAELGGPLVQLPAAVLRDQRIIPLTADAAQAWLEPMLGELSVDVEHSGYQLGHRDYALRLVQLGDEGSAAVLNPADPAQAAVIAWALANAKMLHAHSALADLTPLVHAGLADMDDVWGKMRDTVILAKLSDPSLCDSDEAGLKPLARALLGPDYALSWKCDELRKELFAAGGWLTECEVTTPVARSGWAQVPLGESFVRYAASDVLDCAAIARVLGVS